MRKLFNRKIILLLVFILTMASLGFTSVFAYKVSSVSAQTTISAESAGTNSVKIAWNVISGASGYNLYRSNSEAGPYSLIKNTTSTSYIDVNLIAGNTYYYKMKSYTRNKSGRIYSAYSVVIAAIPGSATPTTPPTTTAPTITTPITTALTTTALTTTTTTTTTPTTTTAISSISVKSYGAAGDGVTNDTAAIQRALNTGAPIISVPDGTYMIDALVSLKPKSNQTVQLSSNAILKVIPTASGSYQIFYLTSVTNVEISGGKLVGDRSGHLGSSGEYGMGILISKGSDNIRIKSMTIRDCWGDGIYIGSDSSGIARNILIDNVICDNNRRQGLTITQAEYVTVRNSTFKNTKGISPQAGLDIEPNAGCHVSNVTIKSCQFADNTGYGLVINAAEGQYARTINIDNCQFARNSHGLVIGTRNASDISCVIPAGTTRINDGEYAQCYGLNRITIPSSVTAIGSGAFLGCESLTSVTIPNSVTTIGLEAFKYCTGLTSVNIPASVTAIDNWAFIGCSNLRSAYFYGNAPTSTNYIFYNCAADFKVNYISGKTGFTSPTWRGYPATTFVP